MVELLAGNNFINHIQVVRKLVLIFWSRQAMVQFLLPSPQQKLKDAKDFIGILIFPVCT